MFVDELRFTMKLINIYCSHGTYKKVYLFEGVAKTCLQWNLSIIAKNGFPTMESLRNSYHCTKDVVKNTLFSAVHWYVRSFFYFFFHLLSKDLEEINENERICVFLWLFRIEEADFCIKIPLKFLRKSLQSTSFRT